MRKVKKYFIYATALIFSLISATPSSAGTFGSTYAGVWYGRTTLGQTFTIPSGNSVKINSITVDNLYFRSPTWTGCVIAKIYTSTAKTTLLDTSSNTVCDTNSAGELTGTPGSGALTFPGTTTYTASTQYFYELSVASGSSQFFTGQASPGTSYTGGDLFVDGSLNTSYDLSFTLTYTIANVPVVFNSLVVSSNLRYRTSSQITANLDSSAKVTFYAKNKKISGCINLTTSGSSPNIVATCNWRPSGRGKISIHASAVPSAALTPISFSSSTDVFVGARSGTR